MTLLPWFHGAVRRPVSRRFDFAASSSVRAFVIVSGAATLVLVASLPLDRPLRVSVALLVAALCAREWRGAGKGLAGMVIRSDASVTALGCDGRTMAGELVEGCIALPLLATIAWRGEGERRARLAFVPCDALAREPHRQLRVLLRYATSGDEQDAPESQARASMSTALSPLLWPARR